MADRPDEGAFVEGSVLEWPPHPGPLPQFFARTLPCNTTQHPQKIGGEGGNMAVSSKLNSVMFADSDPPKVPIDQCLPRERSPFSPSGGEGGRQAG